MTPANSSNREVTSADDWREYEMADFGVEIDLAVETVLPRMVVLKEAGDLYLRSARGNFRVLTDLPAGYVHMGNTRAIMPGQTAALIVYW